MPPKKTPKSKDSKTQPSSSTTNNTQVFVNGVLRSSCANNTSNGSNGSNGSNTSNLNGLTGIPELSQFFDQNQFGGLFNNVNIRSQLDEALKGNEQSKKSITDLFDQLGGKKK